MLYQEIPPKENKETIEGHDKKKKKKKWCSELLKNKGTRNAIDSLLP